jgi:DNA topoisomerase I
MPGGAKNQRRRATRDDCPVDDPEAVAEAAGLRYVSDEQPGIRRVRRGKGFSYVDADRRTINDAKVIERIKALAVPPAWTDVWLCRDPRGHLQATGRDARGRKQYRYHPRWRTVRDADKFDHLVDFAEALPAVRRRVARDLALDGLPRERVLALVVRLLDETLIRVGNAEYAEENDTFGLTTLRGRHVRVGRGSVVFDFVGKGGIEHEIKLADARLARTIRRCHELGGKTLFTYVDEDDKPAPVDSGDVNAYLRDLAGETVSAKDFRTWGGTVLAGEYLVGVDDPDDPAETVLAAIDHAAEALGNTRTVCRNCYVHPAVIEAYEKGALQKAYSKARAGDRFRRSERAVLDVLS